jgi:hypothetical protein
MKTPHLVFLKMVKNLWTPTLFFLKIDVDFDTYLPSLV